MKLARSFDTGHGVSKRHQQSTSLNTEVMSALLQKEESRHHTTVPTVSVMARVINTDTQQPTENYIFI